jgi:6-phosphogluconate dehydrogenase
MSYTQGLYLLKIVSLKFEWDLNLGEIARIWKGILYFNQNQGGCIIRA